MIKEIRPVKNITKVVPKKIHSRIAVIPSTPGPKKVEPQQSSPSSEVTIRAVTDALTLVARGIESLSEQNKMVLQNSVQLQKLVARIAKPAQPKLIDFTITHRDQDGNVAGFTAKETIEETKPDVKMVEAEEVKEDGDSISEQPVEESFTEDVDISILRTTADRRS